MRELLLLVLTVGAFEPSSLSQKVKMGLNSFLLDQFDMDVIRTEVKVSFSSFFCRKLTARLEPVYIRLA